MTNTLHSTLFGYLEACYWIKYQQNEFTFRIGKITKMTSSLATKSFTFITAYNPLSVAQSDAANNAAMQSLRIALEGLSLEFYLGRSFSPDNSWEEPTFVVFNLPLVQADYLARQFSQHAIVHQNLNEAARLRVYGAMWSKIFTHDNGIKIDRQFVDWVP